MRNLNNVCISAFAGSSLIRAEPIDVPNGQDIIFLRGKIQTGYILLYYVNFITKYKKFSELSSCYDIINNEVSLCLDSNEIVVRRKLR